MLSHCANLARNDLFFLLRYGMRREDAERQWVLDRCREVQEQPNGCLDLWSREHYKSSVITIALTLQNILNNPDLTVGIFSHTRPIAKAFLRQIKQELETNEILKSWFPETLYSDPRNQSPKWSEDEGIVVKRTGNPKEATVEAWGIIDGQPTSKHFDILVYDDVVTEKSVTTPEMVKKTTDAWELSLNLGKEGGHRRIIGTRYHDSDTYGTILERQVARPRIYPCTQDGTATGAPVLFSKEYIEDKRRAMTPYNFSTQMLLDPMPDASAYFAKDLWQTYRLGEAPQGIRYMASDWAITHGAGDYTVIGVGVVDHNDDLYLTDWWRGQEAPDKSVEQAVRMMKKHRPRDHIAENTVIERSVAPLLRRVMRSEGYLSTAEQYISAAGKKDEKAQSIRGRMANGKVFLPTDAPWYNDLVAEMLRFPYGSHDDQVDVLSLFGRRLDEMVKGKPLPKPPEPLRGKTWNDIERESRLRSAGIIPASGYAGGI
jgi:predicted phage terminase large subunit-like protein